MNFTSTKKALLVFSLILTSGALKASTVDQPQGNVYKVTKSVFAAPKTTTPQATEKFYVSGHSFAIDPNVAFFLETQNPEFQVNFVSSTGERRTKYFKARINTVGLKIEATIKIEAIALVNTDDKFFNAKEIELGTGIDSNLAAGLGLGITYVPFINVPGGMMIISFLPIGFVFPSISLVTGGTLTTVDY